MQPEKQFLFTHEGQQYVGRVYRDEDMGPPWKEHDGHGEVRSVMGGEPGWRHLWNGQYYNWDAAIETAKRDGWGPGTPEEAVQADFDYIKRWLKDDWYWIGVSVVKVEPDGTIPEEQYSNAVWGFESDGEYYREVALECAKEIA